MGLDGMPKPKLGVLRAYVSSKNVVIFLVILEVEIVT